jgi:hypothetical protein
MNNKLMTKEELEIKINDEISKIFLCERLDESAIYKIKTYGLCMISDQEHKGNIEYNRYKFICERSLTQDNTIIIKIVDNNEKNII